MLHPGGQRLFEGLRLRGWKFETLELANEAWSMELARHCMNPVLWSATVTTFQTFQSHPEKIVPDFCNHDG
ncbi:hypothetical protein A4X13_0g4051 [Tilletia indica]|uniref:Uncharacterized protein n=1 Tax=Tilletia indica TaxID=43049 RepID=A0A177TSX5_9BASI|nr:hypothetical protein A4X13_0g4051 [Tilletia indica]